MTRTPRAFSLIELLIVMGIIVLLATVSVPAVSSLMRGTNLNRGGQIISDQFIAARQEASARNCDIQVRLYQIDGRYRASRLWRIEQGANGPLTNPASRMIILPDGIEIRTNGGLSPLIAASGSYTGTESIPSRGSTAYTWLRFRPNGSFDGVAGTASAYLTLAAQTDSANPPANFYTVMLNPLTGKPSVFRP